MKTRRNEDEATEGVKTFAQMSAHEQRVELIVKQRARSEAELKPFLDQIDADDVRWALEFKTWIEIGGSLEWAVRTHYNAFAAMRHLGRSLPTSDPSALPLHVPYREQSASEHATTWGHAGPYLPPPLGVQGSGADLRTRIAETKRLSACYAQGLAPEAAPRMGGIRFARTMDRAAADATLAAVAPLSDAIAERRTVRDVSQPAGSIAAPEVAEAHARVVAPIFGFDANDKEAAADAELLDGAPPPAF